MRTCAWRRGITLSAAVGLTLTLLPRGAVAQSAGRVFPDSAGTIRGLQELNTSGQTGTVTLHKISDSKTEVVLNVKGSEASRSESAGIVRDPAADCQDIAHQTVAQKLAPLVDGRSRTTVAMSIDTLLSGNYLVVVHSPEKAEHLFACGQLFR